MNILIKTAFGSALALGAFTAATPAMAGEDGIVVQSRAAMEEWSQDVTRSLNRRLAQVEQFSNTIPKPGIVQLRFTLDENGRPGEMKVVRSSGHTSTDNLAKRAVRKLRNLDEAPVGNAREQLFQANIIYANDVFEHGRLADELARSERSRIALNSDEAEVLSFGG